MLKKTAIEAPPASQWWHITGSITITERCGCRFCTGCRVAGYAFAGSIMPSPKKWTALAAQIIVLGGRNPPEVTPALVDQWERTGEIVIRPATGEEICKWLCEHTPILSHLKAMQ